MKMTHSFRISIRSEVKRLISTPFFVQQADFLQQRLSLMLENPLKHLDLLTHGRDPVNFIHMCGSDVILCIRNALIHDAQGIAHSAVSQLSD